MKIITWNLWNQNPDQIGSIKNLINKGMDVICLQEVMLETVLFYQKYCLESQKKHLETCQNSDLKLESSDYLSDLFQKISLENLSQKKKVNLEDNFSQEQEKTDKWQIFTALDHRDSNNQHYLIILTRLSVCNYFCDYLDKKPPKSFLAKRYKIQSIRQFQYIDLIQNEQKIRIFNTHLEIAVGPTRRFGQFENLVKHLSRDNIICGDFNIFPHPIGSFFVGWAANFSLGDYKTNERKKFETLFKKLGLKNLFAKKITYPKYKLQLDHILTSNNLLVVDKKIEKKTTFSDHCQLYCEIKI